MAKKKEETAKRLVGVITITGMWICADRMRISQTEKLGIHGTWLPSTLKDMEREFTESYAKYLRSLGAPEYGAKLQMTCRSNYYEVDQIL